MASKLKSFVVRRGNARFTEKAESFKELIMELDAHQRLYPNATPVSFVREGDFVSYGDAHYEITTLKEPKELFGQADRRIEVSAECIRSREGLFDAS